MPHTVCVEEENQCIVTRHGGEIDEAEIRAGMKEIFRIAHEFGLRRLLIDWRSATHVPSGGVFWHVLERNFEELKLRLGLKRAIVCRSDQRLTAETLAIAAENRELTFKVFEDEPAAVAWLTGSVDSTENPE